MKRLLLSMMMLGATVMLKAQNPYRIYPIDSVQYVNDTRLSTTGNTFPDLISPVYKDSVYRDTVRFEGIVITNPKIYGLSTSRKAAYIQRKGGGPWSGVLVMCEPAGIVPTTTLAALNTETKFYDNFVVGYKVRVTGVIRDFQGETQVNLIKNNANWDNYVEQVSLVPDTLVYTEITADKLMTGNPNTGWVQQKLTAEQYEGTLVTVRNVSVYSITVGSGSTAGRYFWNVIDDYGNVLDVRDMSAYYRNDNKQDSVNPMPTQFIPPPVGTRLEYIRGVVTEYAASGVQRYGICPIYPSDFKVCTSCPPIVKYVNRNPIIAKTTDTLNVTFEITVGDTTLRNSNLYYKKPGSTTMDSVLMTAVPSFPNYYVAKVNPIGIEGVFTFWVRAEDKRGRQTFFPDPLTIGKSIYITTNGVNSISLLQYSNTNSYSSIWDKDSLLNINVPGVVTGIYPSMLTVQAGTGPNSAIFIQKGNNGTVSNWHLGDSVQITRATVGETFNTTNLYNILGSVISSGNPLPPFAMNLPLDSFVDNKILYARPYEGVLMHFDSLKVFSANPDGPASDFGEFSIQAKNATPTSGLRIDDLSANFKGWNKWVKAGMPMHYIQGPMYFANGNFKLIPRDGNDADFSAIDSVKPVLTLKGLNPDTAILGTGSYVDSGAMAMDNIDGDITSKIVVTGTVNKGTVGTYTLVYNVSDAWGNKADSIIRTVVVIDTAHVGINENEMNFAQLTVYPNPATTAITVSGNFIKTQPITITLVDLLGKEISTRTVRGTQFNEIISTENLNNGIYFCTISNASGSKTLKFVVNGK